jgi:hypothetical protein
LKSPAWLKATILLTTTFAVGVAVGITYQRRVPVAASTATDAHDALSHLTSELNLDVGQKNAIAAILRRRQSDVDAAWRTMQPHLRTALETTSNEVVAVLRPDQVAKYRRMMDARHSKGHH